MRQHFRGCGWRSGAVRRRHHGAEAWNRSSRPSVVQGPVREQPAEAEQARAGEHVDRAQRQKAAAARRGEAPPEDAEPAEAEEPVPANGPSPSTSATKRKRKRR